MMIMRIVIITKHAEDGRGGFMIKHHWAGRSSWDGEDDEVKSSL